MAEHDEAMVPNISCTKSKKQQCVQSYNILRPVYAQSNSRAPGGEGNCHGIGEIGLAGNGARREMGKTRNMGWEEGGKHTFSETESGQMMCSL